jgi:subtilisin family serine protease
MNKLPSNWMDTMGIGAKVMVIDTGFNPDPNVVAIATRTFIGGGITDIAGLHGTMMAKIVASRDPTDAGFAPRCTLWLAKAVGLTPGLSGIQSALQWALDEGVDVVSMSFVYSGDFPKIHALIEKLDAKGVILLAAHNLDKKYPHTYPEVVSVAQAGLKGQGNIRTLGEFPKAGGKTIRGSSVATAVMAGIAACAKSYNPAINRASFEAQFSST